MDYVPGHDLLAGKRVLVTAAAGTGIGFATAKRCIEEGARVLVSDAHERRLGETAAELGAPSAVCDVTDEMQVRRPEGILERPLKPEVRAKIGDRMTRAVLVGRSAEAAPLRAVAAPIHPEAVARIEADVLSVRRHESHLFLRYRLSAPRASTPPS